MTGDLHDDHALPGIADQRAVLATARAMLADASPDVIHDEAAAGACPVCTAVAAVSFGFALVASAAGEMTGLSEPLRRRLLKAIGAAQQELDSGAN